MPRKTKFVESRLSSPDYALWIVKVTSGYSAKCRWCFKKFDVFSMGESTFKSHLISNKHVENHH